VRNPVQPTSFPLLKYVYKGILNSNMRTYSFGLFNPSIYVFYKGNDEHDAPAFITTDERQQMWLCIPTFPSYDGKRPVWQSYVQTLTFSDATTNEKVEIDYMKAIREIARGN